MNLRIPIFLLLTASLQAEVPKLFSSTGSETNGVWHLPAEVRQVLRKPDGSFVLATLGDEEKRQGEIDGNTWIPGDDMLKAHGLLPEPQLIDRSGQAWFVGHGAGIPAVSTDGVTTNVYTAKKSFQGMVEEDQSGRVWLSERGGAHLIQNKASLWLSTAEGNKVPPQKGRFHDVIDLPNQYTLVTPRSIYSPRYRQPTDEKPGFAHLFADGKNPKPIKVPLKYGSVQQALPQADNRWLFLPEAIPGRSNWNWMQADAKPPAELEKLLASLGAGDPKERRQAADDIKANYRSWQSYLNKWHLTVEDPEVRLQIRTIVDGWEKAGEAATGLPEMEDRFPIWDTADYLRTPDPDHAWITVLLAHKKERPKTYQAPFCALLKVDAKGAYTVVAKDIPITARPGRLYSETASGYDLIPLDGDQALYRDKQGLPCLIDGGTAHRLPDLILPGSWPVPETTLLGEYDGDLMLRQRGAVWWIPSLADRLKKREPVVTINTEAFMTDRLVERTANEITNLQRTGGKPETVKELLDRLIASNPHRQEGYNTRMLLNLAERKSVGLLLPDFHLMLALEPGQAYDYWRNGQVLSDTGANRRALRAYGAAYRLSPIDPRYIESRGDLHAQVGMFKAALADFEEAVLGNPNKLETRMKLAQTYGNLEDNESAIKELNQVIESDATLATAYSQRALIYSRMDEDRKSLKDHDKSIELDPENPMLYMRRGNFRVFRQMPIMQAKADFEKALELSPDNPEVKNNLAWMLATYPDPSIRDGKRALKLAMEASEFFDHKMDYIVDTLAACYAETGDFANAVKWQQHAISVSRDEDIEQYKAHLESFLIGLPVREPDVE